MKIERAIVAHLDILGFRSMVRAPGNREVQCDLLNQAMKRAVQPFRGVNGPGGRDRYWRIRAFSDCVCVAVPYSEIGLLSILEGLGAFSRELLASGFPIRGGVTMGPYEEYQFLIFSEAQVRAFDIENQSAIVPRVVLSEDLIEAIDCIDDDEVRKSAKEFVVLDADGVAFINHLVFDEEDSWSIGARTYHSMTKVITSALRERTIETTVREKYEWLASFHNWALAHTARLFKTLAAPTEDDIWSFSTLLIREYEGQGSYRSFLWSDKSFSFPAEELNAKKIDWIRAWPGVTTEDDQMEEADCDVSDENMEEDHRGMPVLSADGSILDVARPRYAPRSKRKSRGVNKTTKSAKKNPSQRSISKSQTAADKSRRPAKPRAKADDGLDPGVQEAVSVWIEAVRHRLLPKLMTDLRFVDARKLAERFEDAASLWALRPSELTRRNMIEVGNEIAVAVSLLCWDYREVGVLCYRRPIENCLTVDFSLSDSNGNSACIFVRTLVPEWADDDSGWLRLRRAAFEARRSSAGRKRKASHTRISTWQVKASWAILNQTIETEKKVALIQQASPGPIWLLLCSDLSGLACSNLEQFADYYRTGRLLPEDWVTHGIDRYLSDMHATFTRTLAGFHFLSRGPDDFSGKLRQSVSGKSRLMQ